MKRPGDPGINHDIVFVNRSSCSYNELNDINEYGRYGVNPGS